MKPYLRQGFLFGGLVSGVVGLLLVTRNLVSATRSGTYSVVVHFNRFDEYWFDVIALAALWAFWLVGIIMYLKHLKEVEAI